MKYYINGWQESRSYFMSVGHFTTYEMNALLNGETVIKNGNEFYIKGSD